MRPITILSTIFALVLTTSLSADKHDRRNDDGQQIFRYDTFGDEQLWTTFLRMHEALAQVDPATALSVGLKVDVEALPPSVIHALRAGQVNLSDPAVTIELLRLNAVVGVKGAVDGTGHLRSVGITCALCHSTVDDSLAPGIGHRLDGWANRTLNVGAIVSLSPVLPEALKEEFRLWGPGRYDPRHHAFDGTNLNLLHTSSVPIEIPSIFGLKGVGFETFTGDGADLVLEQLRRRRADGRPRHLQRRTNRCVHQPKAGSRHAEASCAARLPTASAHAGSAAGFVRQGGCAPWQAAVSQRGRMRHVPSGA